MAIAISLPYTIILTFLTYYMGNLFFNRNIGLIAALIFGVSNITFRFGSYFISPTSVGIIFFSTLLYLTFKKNGGAGAILNKTVSMLIFYTTLLTHTVSTFVIICIQGFSLSIEYVYGNYFGHKNKIISKNYFVVIFVSMLSYWMFTSGFLGYVVKSIIVNLSIDEMIGKYHVIDNPFSINYLIDYMDYILFFSFSAVGCLITINHKIINKQRFMHMSIGVFLLSLAVIGTAFSFNAIVPTRLYSFSLVILSIYIALSIMIIGGSINNKRLQTILIIFILISITFFNITSTESNVNDGTAINVLALRYGLFESELISANTIINKFDEKPLTDAYYLIHIVNDLNPSTRDTITQEEIKRLPSITPYLLNRSLNSSKMNILIRKNVFDRPFYDFNGLVMIDYNLDIYMQENKFNLLYNSSYVNLYD
ncbi:MAG: hypothetical protein Q8N08_05995 [Methanobacteriaceae archaeon]|nr:hypothetical protein [Methanobacteriaceae archaeon]